MINKKIYGLTGMSGAGKSTILRLLLRFYAPTKGQILINGIPIEQISFTELHQRIAFLEQDTYLFDATIAENIGVAKPDAAVEEIKTAAKRAGIAEFIETLPDGYDTDMGQMSARLSGGERQRIGIARALVMQPEFIVADEPISALDVSIRAQVLNLLNEMKKSRGLTYLFIAHDLSVVRFISDRIAVISKGRIVELAEAEELFLHPLHPYTKALLSAVPIPDPALEKNKKLLVYDPSIHDYSVEKPVWEEIANGHFVYGNQRELEGYRKEYESQL